MEERFLRFDYRQFNQANLLRILGRLGDPWRLRLLYISTYRANCTRTESLLSLFSRADLHVKTLLLGHSRLRHIRVVRDLIWYGSGCDLVFVAFRGREILPILRIFTRRPIIFDALVSVYDTLCLDRAVVRPDSSAGRYLSAYDRFLCRISDVVLVDTPMHREYLERRFGASKVDYLYVGCNEDLFQPMSVERDSCISTVLWYGLANPLQGVDVILRAARLLKGRGVRSRLIGPVRRKYAELLDRLALDNTEMVDAVPYERLPVEIAKADLCLGGHFSDRDKAKRVIAGETFQFLSCRKPTLVGDKPANQDLFVEGDLVHFVEMNSPEALASKIAELTQEPTRGISSQGQCASKAPYWRGKHEDAMVFTWQRSESLV